MLPERIGRYEVRGVAGSGGFATVYQGFDPRLDARVAIKVLADNWSRDPEVRRRFRQEAVLLRRLQTEQGVPGLVEVFDIDETKSGQPFFVMGWADRGTLADRSGDKAWPTADVAPVIAALTQSLGHLHAAGVVHRDIKPQNLLLRSDRDVTTERTHLVAPGERLVVGDLGLAKDLTSDASALSMVAGTERYMAPEQLRPGAPIDHRADIYAATAMVGDLLAGSADQNLLPCQIRTALETGLEVEPDDRYDTMYAWQNALLAAFAAPARAAPDGPTVSDLDGAVDQTQSDPPTPSRLWRVFGMAGAVAAVVAFAAIMMLSGGGDNPIAGPATILSGETGRYVVEAETTSSIEWTDPSGETVVVDALEVTGRLPGRLTLQALVDGERYTRSVIVEPSPQGPTIIGPEIVRRGEQGIFSAAVSVGHTFYWIHPTRGELAATELAVVQSGEQFVVGLISVDDDGVERGAQMLVVDG